jgi:hypothetical protein
MTRHLIRSTFLTACLLAGLGAGYAVDHMPTTGACATMTINPCAELDTSQVIDMRGTPVEVGDLNEIVAVATDDGAPADLVACWIANGAHGDPTDGSETLYATRLVIEACSPIGWVSV